MTAQIIAQLNEITGLTFEFNADNNCYATQLSGNSELVYSEESLDSVNLGSFVISLSGKNTYAGFSFAKVPSIVSAYKELIDTVSKSIKNDGYHFCFASIGIPM
ncbi:hypothetical protein N9137_02260 [Pseudomonadales bacterium]|nr:hypothetical protein [Pseudomonadales bacterium]